MNLATIIALLVLVVILIPAIRYLYKYGTCGNCPDHGSCSGKCESKRMLKDFMDTPDYQEKNEMIDEIIKKHIVTEKRK
ncbi:hypothetical protein SAMN06297422_10385 [Lachnospiraceae bacterium]|nr:hypothetical protein SAMN06297422_10385 [Lachnospiraceae bacterium]